jgi:hypothetical protein
MKAMSHKRHKAGSRELLNKPAGEGADKVVKVMRQSVARAEKFCKDLVIEYGTIPAPLIGGKSKPSMDPRFPGILALLGLYARLGQHHAILEYSKELSPLMSRTNLGVLPLELRNHYKLLEGILYVSEAPNKDARLFKEGFKSGSWGPTIGEWVQGIQNGDDPLRGEMSNLPRMEGVAPIVDLVMNNNHEIIATELRYAAQGIIVELRGMQEGLPRNKWLEVAENLREFVAALNASPESYKAEYTSTGAYGNAPPIAVPNQAPPGVAVPPQAISGAAVFGVALRPTRTKETRFAEFFAGAAIEDPVVRRPARPRAASAPLPVRRLRSVST